MATITKVSREAGSAYKAVIRLQGIKPFSKTFKLRKDAKTWAERMERNVDEARAYGNSHLHELTLTDLIREYVAQGCGRGTVSRLTWWKQEYGDRRLIDITHDVVRQALKELADGKAHPGQRQRRVSLPQPASGRRRRSTARNRPLSSVFEFGREHYGLAVNPCRGIKRRPENNTRVRFLTETERKNLLTACKSSEWGSLYLLTLMAITTGARLGVKKVQISFSGNGCESCEKLDGKTMTIGKALKDMPLPRKNRTADVFGNEVPFCRCLYVSTD